MKDLYTCTINDFIACWFNGNYAVIGEGATKADYEKIREGYIDIAGLFAGRDFSMVCQLVNYDLRINAINNMIAAQRDLINLLGVPSIPHLTGFKDYNYTVNWTGDKEAFLKRLREIELKEKKVHTNAAITEKQLKDMREKNIVVKRTNAQERADFTKMLISLQRSDYPIRKDETTVYELALMIKSNKEEAENIQQQLAQKKVPAN